MKLPVIIGGMASDPLTLGMRIRRARERARLSQEELAKLVDASPRAVGDWENDRRKPRNRLGALEEVLGVRLDGEPEPGPLISESLLRAIAEDETLSDGQRIAVIAAVDETLARERGERGPTLPRAGGARQRPAS